MTQPERETPEPGRQGELLYAKQRGPHGEGGCLGTFSGCNVLPGHFIWRLGSGGVRNRELLP
jgi:hypothetical protein